MHNEIHNVKKGGEALPSQVLQVVAEGRPAHKGLSKAQRAQCPLVGVYLIYGVDYGMDWWNGTDGMGYQLTKTAKTHIMAVVRLYCLAIAHYNWTVMSSLCFLAS